jgi:hypothetical protein
MFWRREGKVSYWIIDARKRFKKFNEFNEFKRFGAFYLCTLAPLRDFA